MFYRNGELSLGVHTVNGPSFITSGNLPASVISYVTGTQVPVVGVRRLDPEPTYSVTFTDDRVTEYRESEQIYLGGKIIQFSRLLETIFGRSKLKGEIKPQQQATTIPPFREFTLTPHAPVEYEIDDSGKIKPDPYTVGFILPVADLCRPEINLPGKYSDMISSVLIKNKWEIISGETVDTVMFSYSGSKDDHPIQWTDFFSAAVERSLRSSKGDVPPIYLLSGIPERWEFIRGFFDSVYRLPPNEESIIMEISCEYLARLTFIRNILLSLGITSLIVTTQKGKDTLYVLRLIMDTGKFASFFNNVITVKNILLWDSKLTVKPSSSVSVKKIAYIGSPSTFAIQLDQPGIYMVDNFLPRVSQ